MPVSDNLKKWGLFIISSILLIVIGYLFFYDSVQREVKSTSRCIRERRISRNGGLYTVYANTAANKNVYKVTYDMTPGNSNPPSIECACQPGNNINRINDIPYYHNSTTKKENKICSCETNMTTDINDQLYYIGDPGLVSYMNNNSDTTFFNK